MTRMLVLEAIRMVVFAFVTWLAIRAGLVALGVGDGVRVLAAAAWGYLVGWVWLHVRMERYL